MEYLPGIGDYLAKYLPQIGQNAQQIFAPHLTAQRKVWEEIMSDPEKLNSYIDVARQDPSALGLKPEVNQQLAGREYTKTRQQTDEARETATKIAGEQLEKYRADNERIKGHQATISEWAKVDPTGFVEWNRTVAQKGEGGITTQEMDEARYRLNKFKDDEEANNRANAFLTKYKTLDEAIEGLGAASPEEIGAILSAPNAQALRLKWQEKLASDRDEAIATRQEAHDLRMQTMQDARLQAQADLADKKAQEKVDKSVAAYMNGARAAVKDVNTRLDKGSLSPGEAQSNVATIQGYYDQIAALNGEPPKRVVYVSKDSWLKRMTTKDPVKENQILILNADGTIENVDVPQSAIKKANAPQMDEKGNIIKPPAITEQIGKSFKGSKNFNAVDAAFKDDPEKGLANLESMVAQGYITQADSDELKRRYGNK